MAKIGSWSYNLSTKVIEWSDETFRVWEFDIDKGVPKLETMVARAHADDKEVVLEALTLRKPFDLEHRICLPNNKIKWIRTICEPIYNNKGEVISLSGSNQDITETKRVRIQIEEAEKMYRILTNNSNDIISLHQKNIAATYVSPSVKYILGYQQDEFLSKKIFNLIHKDDVKYLKEKLRKRKSTGNYKDSFSFRVLHKDGHFVWLEYLSSPVFVKSEISYFVSSARDITERINAKYEIQKYQTSLQKLTTEITLIEEKQKKEIATNIHDHLSQSLVISKMKINELKKNQQLNLISEELSFLEVHISKALENSRKITYELSPPILYQLGILDAINWLLESVEATHNIAYKINSNIDSVTLSDAESILLYRSLQEVINNIIKYANATLITIDFDKNIVGLDIFVSDNGVGFDTSLLNNIHNQSGNGFGLFTIQERIKNIQGRFSIKSRMNIGTTVKFFIPLSK